MEHQNHYFTIQSIPMEAACNPLLSPSDKIIYASLYFLKKSSNAPCIVSDEYLATYNQLSIISVGRSLKKLEDLQYINRNTFKIPTNEQNYSIKEKFKNQRYIYIQNENIWVVLMDIWNYAFPQKNNEARECWNDIVNNLPKEIDFKKIVNIIADIIFTYQKIYIVLIKNDRWCLSKNIDILKRNIIKEYYKEKLSKDNYKKSEKSDSNSFNETFDKQKKSKKEITIANTFENHKSRNLIKLWNSFDQTTNHSIDKPYTKTYQKLIKEFSKLQKGTFAKNKSFNSKWIKEKGIPKEYFNKAWSYQELRNAINDLSKYSLEGYWPQDDKNFFKNLTNLIYNPINKNSWLLNTIANPPKQLKEKLEDEFENTYPKTTEIIKNSFIWGKDKIFNERKLCKNIKELKGWADNLINDEWNKSTYFFGDLQKIVPQYLQWLEMDSQDWITKEERILSINSKIFTMFIEDQEKELSIKIRSKNWKRK